MLWAEKNGTIGNASYILTITGELTQQLSDDCWLDVNFETPNATGLPRGMDNVLVLAVVNVTGYPGNGWSYKPDTLKYALKISNDTIKNLDPAETYYLVRFNGASYLTQKIDGAEAGLSPATFNVDPPGDNGIFTILEAVKPTPIPTSVPTPTPIPSPAPVPLSAGITNIALLIVMFAIGAIVGAAALFLVTRYK